jgi:hypothetical protein
MEKFLCFEVVFFVVLDVSDHLFFINNLKILNSDVLKKLVISNPCMFQDFLRVHLTTFCGTVVGKQRRTWQSVVI